MNKQLIVCVEDDDDIRELMRYSLSMAGYEAIGLSNGEALFDLLKKKENRRLFC